MHVRVRFNLLQSSLSCILFEQPKRTALPQTPLLDFMGTGTRYTVFQGPSPCLNYRIVHCTILREQSDSAHFSHMRTREGRGRGKDIWRETGEGGDKRTRKGGNGRKGESREGMEGRRGEGAKREKKGREREGNLAPTVISESRRLWGENRRRWSVNVDVGWAGGEGGDG